MFPHLHGDVDMLKFWFDRIVTGEQELLVFALGFLDEVDHLRLDEHLLVLGFFIQSFRLDVFGLTDLVDDLSLLHGYVETGG